MEIFIKRCIKMDLEKEFSKETVFKTRYNASKINGEFGEHLVMFQLMAYKGWNVEYIDYYGADLIAIDPKNNKKYAIQVKSRHFVKDGETNTAFDINSELSLRKFCDNYSSEKNGKFIPLVAYVNINHDQSINTFIVNLDWLVVFTNKNKQRGCSVGLYKKGEYTCNSNSGLQSLINNEKIMHFRMTMDSMRRGEVDQELKVDEEKLVNDRKKELDEYNENKSTKNKHSQNNRNNQIGDFGELYFILKAVASNQDPFLVKSEGADVLILNNHNNKDSVVSQAISVKTFSKQEHDSYTFESKNAKNLRKFAKKWNAKPVVTLQQLIYKEVDGKKQYFKMYNFTMDLDYMKNTSCEYLHFTEGGYKTKGGYKIDWSGDNLKLIENDDNIEFDVVVFDEPFLYDEIHKEHKKDNKKCQQKDC